MPSPLKNKWSIKSLLEITSQVAQNRFETWRRDCVKSSVKVKRISVYKGLQPGLARTKILAESSSYPNYYPYLTSKDSRGRSRTTQKKYRHTYSVILQMDELNINVPVKIRTGSEKQWVTHPPINLIKSKKNPNGQYLSIGDYNIVVNGIFPDMLFTTEYYRSQDGCLFGRNRALYAPDKIRNPYGVNHLHKHEINMIETMLNAGIFSK